MRCKACNAILGDLDMVRKDNTTGEYLDLCQPCYVESQAAVFDASDPTPTLVVIDEPLALTYEYDWAVSMGIYSPPAVDTDGD